jgi:transcriptional regulator with XRE-family HTH domain
MDLWQSSAMRRAVAGSDRGAIIRLARRSQGLTQRELAEACGYRQPMISKIERGERGAENIDVLSRVADHLQIRPHLLGLAEKEIPVNRRQFLVNGAAVTAGNLVPTVEWSDPTDHVGGFRQVTGAYRRLDAVIPGRELTGPAEAHLTMGLRLLERAKRPADVHTAPLAAAVSESAGLAAWLAWDAANLGNARRHYITAITTAKRAGDRLLTAYMTGSLASLAVDQGDSAEGLALLRSARTHLGADRPATADAWLACQQALAHAAAGEGKPTWAALDVAEAACARVDREEPPPWPWVFAFDHAKVAAHRLTCAARLGQPRAALTAASDAASYLNAGHGRQRALLGLDLAEAQLHTHAVDEAFAIANQALELAAPYNSGRVAQRARGFRRTVTGRVPQHLLREFDERLRTLV